MLSLESTGMRLEVSSDTQSLLVVDRIRNCVWPAPLDPKATISQSDWSILIVINSPQATLRYCWTLAQDHARCTLTVTGPAASELDRAPLCPTFHPVDHNPQAIIPLYQGALLRSGTKPWSAEVVRGGHSNLSMGMLALTCPAAALLLVPDRLIGWIGRYGVNSHGPFAAYDAVPIEADGWQETTVRIYPCRPGVEAVAARYRLLMQGRGQWVNWAEKIARKPILDRLFGSLIAFIGYVQDDTTDYVGNVRKLRSMGFDSILAYPARFAHYSALTMADGLPPINLTDAQIAAMQQEGALIAPWAWTFEGKDDGSQAIRSTFRHRATGPAAGWTMDDQQWYHVCPPYQARHIGRRLAEDMRAMDWLHFDVNASHPARACWNEDHDLHLGRPLSPDEDILETRRLMSRATVGNRIVSSEGFNDAYTNTYDIGSTKMVPLDGESPDAVPIPLTMLVYHDCCIHDWWEVHNYNANPCWNLACAQAKASSLGHAGSGEPRLKAAIDALNGLPPNVFPFGLQYGWVDRPGGKTYPFRMSMDDPSVQEALQAALPVTRLHRRIGKLAMTDFAFIDANPLLQRTTFADGTQVTANLGRQSVEVPGIGVMPDHSWRETHL